MTPRRSSADLTHPKIDVMTVAPAAELLDYDEVVTRYEPVLGLEVHVELSTATKMFCGCPTTFGGEPNTQVCPVCLGLPGSLPVLNAAAVESAIRIGLALECEIAPWSRFARKNYFYPDMPKNYQISQYDEPIAINGRLDVPLDDGGTFRVYIERAHMEEDTGKLTHIGSETGRIEGATTSLLDYNRAGVPLIEVVTKPIEGAGERAPQIARAYVTALRDLLRGLGVSDVRMDQGSMRCDTNVSLKPIGAKECDTHTETKNVNSLKSVEVAVRYEMRRQAAILAAGGRVTQETRHFHEDGYTSPGRSKETAQDYRYFPEPDLEPVVPSPELIERLRHTIPELPWLQRKRIQQEWGVSAEVMRDLVNAGAVELVAATVERGASSDAARAWWGNFLVQKANEAGVELEELSITPAHVAAVIALVDCGKLSNKLARQVVEGVLAGEGEPEQVMKARGLELVRDDSLIQTAVEEALAANPDVVEKIRGGKVAAAGAIVGAVMKATRGQADAARVRELVLAACS
jgi:aspartyl-tRNA(Asn)/glutamyl-tRNA(Gln) amidotransferase subunit B